MRNLAYLLVPVHTIFLFISCNNENPQAPNDDLFLGADLSYVNEMEDCGGIYRSDGIVIDPYRLFWEKGANIIRLRLWHSPDWTDYSDLEDVKRSISRAKEQGMKVLLDFHYSDDWADPGKQKIPADWALATAMEELGDLLYDYTYQTLMDLQPRKIDRRTINI